MPYYLKKPGMPVHSAVSAGGVTIYGTDWCGFTQKQKDAFDARQIPYAYVNCDQTTCPSNVTAFGGFPFVTGYPTGGDSWGGFKPL